MHINEALVLFGSLSTGAYSHDDRCFHPDSPLLGPLSLKTSMRGQNQRVRWPSPKNVFEPIFFYYFQQDHALLLRFLPPDLAKN